MHKPNQIIFEYKIKQNRPIIKGTYHSLQLSENWPREIETIQNIIKKTHVANTDEIR